MISFIIPFTIWAFIVIFANALMKEDKEIEDEEREKEIREWNQK